MGQYPDDSGEVFRRRRVFVSTEGPFLFDDLFTVLVTEPDVQVVGVIVCVVRVLGHLVEANGQKDVLVLGILGRVEDHLDHTGGLTTILI